ncbi:MAG: hypothetical protein ACXVAY_00830 [Mucilaginibacter sp.]
MADDINKKISIDVEISTDGQQQIDQYQFAFDGLRKSIGNLGKPISDLSKNITSLDNDLSKIGATSDKSSDKIGAISSSFSILSKVLESVVGALTGWGAALSMGLSLLVAYSPEILKWISGMLKGETTLTALNKVLKDNKIVMEAVIQARAQGNADAQQELVHLKLLYKASQDHNLALNQRKKIVAELQSQYPAYFGSMSTDSILAGKAAKSYDELTKSIIATAQARAAEEIITKNQVRSLGNDDKLQKLKADLTQYNKELQIAQKNYNDYIKHPATGGGTIAAGDGIENNLYDKLAGIRDKVKEVNISISHLNTDSTLLTRQNEALAKTVIKDTEQYGATVLDVASNHIKQSTKGGQRREQAILKSNHKIKKSFESVEEAAKGASDAENKADRNQSRGSQLAPANSAGFIPDDNQVNPQQMLDAKLAETQKTEDQIAKIKKAAIQQVEDYAKQSGVKMAGEAINLLNNNIKQQSATQLAALEKEKNAELSNKSLTAAQKLAIQQKYQQKENQVKAKAFKEEQELSIVQAIINGAEAVTKVSAQAGVLAPLEIGVVVAETAAQISKIASQKPPAYAHGGLHYQSDGRGGVLPGYSRTDNTNAYLRSGEAIVVSEAMRNPWARNLVSAINVGFGGRDFSMPNPGRGYAVGGIFTDGGDANRYYNQPVNDQKNLANSIAYQMINNFPPVYVDVKDINNQQNILAQTINRVNL